MINRLEKIEKIYFDLDGVLADFDRGVEKLCGLPRKNQETHNDEADNEMWLAIKEVPNFYDRLELMPGAIEMFTRIYDIYGERCEILTGIPKEKRGIVTAGKDKMNWVHRLISDKLIVNIVYKEEKKKYCTGQGCILIDDLEQNVDDWKEYGGIGILHKDPDSTLIKLIEMGVLKR